MDLDPVSPKTCRSYGSGSPTLIIIRIIISTGPVPGGERLERGVWREEGGVPSLRCRGSPRLPSSPSRGGHHQQLWVFGIGTLLHHHAGETTINMNNKDVSKY
jgi:hypothetical protein